MKTYIDWGWKKNHTVYTENEIKKLDTKELLQLPISVVYMERGVPYGLIHQLRLKNCRVFLIDGKYVKERRMGVKKTDALDVTLIKLLESEHPELFVEVAEKDDKEIKLKALSSQYRRYTKALARLKQQKQSYEKEFGVGDDSFDSSIEMFESKKKETLKAMTPLITEELGILKPHVKGLGSTILAELLAEANPRKFPSLSSYLKYCGYKASVYYKNPEKGFIAENFKKHYNIKAHTLAWMITKQCILTKGDFYSLYKKFKNDIKNHEPNLNIGVIHRKSLNRVSTYILKIIYILLNTECPEKIHECNLMIDGKLRKVVKGV